MFNTETINVSAKYITLLLPLIDFGVKFAQSNNNYIIENNAFFKTHGIEKTIQSISGKSIDDYEHADYDLATVFEIAKTLIPEHIFPTTVTNQRGLLDYIRSSNDTFSNTNVNLLDSDIKQLSIIFERALKKYLERNQVVIPRSVIFDFIPKKLHNEFSSTQDKVIGRRPTGNMRLSIEALEAFYCEHSLIKGKQELIHEMKLNIK